MAIKNMLFNHSKFLRVEKDETSSVLWFVISHVDIPPGKFAQSGVFKDIPGSKVYLNCPDNSWYQQGIPGQDDSVTSIIRTVEKFIADFSPDEVKFVGHSMGAYLALILGMHNPGSFVIATSPEFVLNLDGSRSLRNNVKPDPMWKSLIEARNADHNDIEGIVVLGVDDPVDAHFLASEEIYNSGFGSIVESPYHHGVTEFLTGLGVYRDLLTDPANAARKLRQMGVCDAPFTNGTSHQYEHFYQTSLMLRDRSTSTLEIVNRINKFPDWEHAGWQELRSRFFRASKDHQAAYSAAELAYSIRPHLPQIAVEYGRACLAAGKYIEANHLIDSLRLINPKHPLHQQLFNLADTKFALRNRHRFASYNRYPAASKRGLRVQAEFSNRPRSILREAKSLLKENDHSRLYEHLHNLNSQDEVKPELLRVAVKTTSRHRLVWLTASYLSELARQDTLTLHQLRVYLATSLRVNR
ncbi:MAG: alpha/beta hydrolase-fold protein [Pseudomonadales bacterium]